MVSLNSAQICLKEISINSNQLDQDFKALKQALSYLGNHSLLALQISPAFGGGGLSKLEYGLWQIAVAKYSGALAFLQTQHQSAGLFLNASNNHIFQQTYLPYLATGKKLIGVGFSQLRRPGKPLVTAEAKKTGYVISGFVPWVTGGNIFTDFIIGAMLADGRELYGVVPLKNAQQTTGGIIQVNEPMSLVAMTATNTVSVELNNWFLENDKVVAIKPANSIHHNSRQNVLNHAWFSLGCVYSALDIMQQIFERKQLTFILETKKSLTETADLYQQQMIEALAPEKADYRDKLQLRSQVINLAFRCAQAAVIMASGAANNLDNAAGRVYREALVFSVSGQTTEVMEASLKLLTKIEI